MSLTKNLFALLVIVSFSFVLCVRPSSSLSDREYRAAFEDFKTTYSVSYYDNTEEEHRYVIFKKNLLTINEWNEEDNELKQQHSFTLKMNRFGDFTSDEYRSLFTNKKTSGVRTGGRRVGGRTDGNVVSDKNDGEVGALPDSWDWRTMGVVSGVTDQGQLGDDVSIVVTETVESSWAIARKIPVVNLSIEQVSACCGTHFAEFGIEYQCIIKNGGVLIGDLSTLCNLINSSLPHVTISSYVDVTSGDEAALQNGVYITPVAVAIDASQTSFQFYSSGVYYEPACTTDVDHALVVVGWGVSTNNIAYWIAKNSWGESWGMDGYILMSRNRSNNCGIASYGSYPVV